MGFIIFFVATRFQIRHQIIRCIISNLVMFNDASDVNRDINMKRLHSVMRSFRIRKLSQSEHKETSCHIVTVSLSHWVNLASEQLYLNRKVALAYVSLCIKSGVPETQLTITKRLFLMYETMHFRTGEEQLLQIRQELVASRREILGEYYSHESMFFIL